MRDLEADGGWSEVGYRGPEEVTSGGLRVAGDASKQRLALTGRREGGGRNRKEVDMVGGNAEGKLATEAFDRTDLCDYANGVSTTKILSILEAAQIEAPKARAIAESLELAFREQEEDLTKRLMTKQDGADLKAEIIKWMFLFWIGQIAALIAVAKLVFGV